MIKPDATMAANADAPRILQQVREYFESAVLSPAYQTWRKEAQEAWSFYDGHQWQDAERESLRQNAQPAIVINKIAAKVDNIAGTEVAGRTRIIYRSRSGVVQEEQTARALSDLALYVAERNDQALEISNVFKAGLVTGIGWLDVGVEASRFGPQVFNRAEDELSVVFDPASRRLDFSDARFVCRERWLNLAEAQALFPEYTEQLASYKGGTDRLGPYGNLAARVHYADQQQDMLRVIEVQYKQPAVYYTVVQSNGRPVTTFDAKQAKQIAIASGAELEQQTVQRVHLAYFVGDVLLEYRPLAYQHQEFTLIPYIFKRDRRDGRPYGMVRAAIDPQRELNKRRSKAMHLLNTAQVIADIDAVEDPHILAREAARPDGLILKRPGKDLRIIRNADLAQSQVVVMEQAARDIQDVLGVYDEAIGKTSNATSGIAIQQRQMASNLNQMFAFDALRRTKRRLGLQILELIRQYFTHEMVIQLTDDINASRQVYLNQTHYLPDGSAVVENDVRGGVYDVHVEEVRDVLSSRELELQQLNLLMQAGVPIPTDVLVDATTLKNKDRILAANRAADAAGNINDKT